MAEFFTPAFFEELADRLNADEEWQRKGGDLSTRIVATATDRDLSMLLEIEDGRVSVSEVTPEEPADFKFEGPYESWVKTAQGEADLQTLVMTGKMQFRGSMSKIMAMMGQLNQLMAVLRDVPREY